MIGAVAALAIVGLGMPPAGAEALVGEDAMVPDRALEIQVMCRKRQPFDAPARALCLREQSAAYWAFLDRQEALIAAFRRIAPKARAILSRKFDRCRAQWTVGGLPDHVQIIRCYDRILVDLGGLRPITPGDRTK